MKVKYIAKALMLVGLFVTLMLGKPKEAPKQLFCVHSGGECVDNGCAATGNFCDDACNCVD